MTDTSSLRNWRLETDADQVCWLTFDKENASALSPFYMLMDIDSHHYLPEDILVKVDRASMAHSLEVRVPYLAKPMLEWA